MIGSYSFTLVLATGIFHFLILFSSINMIFTLSSDINQWHCLVKLSSQAD
jgi:hypothetical protein